MVDTQTAPEWIDSDVCLRCRTAFSFTNRKHHCRNCGQVFDQQCSSKTMALPHYGITQEVRVCDGCHTKLLKKGESHKSHRHSASIHRARHRSARELADAELQRAIQLSLEEVGSADIHRRPGYVPSQPSPSAWQRSEPPIVDRSTDPDSKYTEEDDDPDLRAAIEASLREAQAPRPSAPVAVETPRTENPPFTYEQQPQYQHSQSYPPTSTPVPAIPSVPKLPNYDLEPLESDAILTFSQTVEQVEAQGGRDLSRYPAVNELLDRANGLRPKLAMSLDDTGRKESKWFGFHGFSIFLPAFPPEMLSEMHDKLSQAVKLYDNLLTQQVSHPIWSRSPPPQAVQYQSVNPGYNPAYHAPNGPYAQWAPQQPPQMQIQAPPMSPGYQQHPGLATPRQTQVSNFQPTQSTSQYAPQAPAELTYSPRVSSPPSVDQWQQQSMYAEPSQQAQYAPPPSQPSYVPQSPQHYSETPISAPPPPASIPHYNPPQPSMAPPSSSVRLSSPPAPLSQPASIPQYNPPQPSMVPPSPEVPQSSPPVPVSQPLSATPAPPNPTTFPPPSANPSSSGLARHNTMSVPRPLQQAQNSYLSRHNTIAVGPHAQQHQQAPLPQFPVAPTSAPQSFPLYGPSIPDNLPQPDRKEALLIDL